MQQKKKMTTLFTVFLLLVFCFSKNFEINCKWLHEFATGSCVCVIYLKVPSVLRT